jgi:hypothetical protein
MRLPKDYRLTAAPADEVRYRMLKSLDVLETNGALLEESAKALSDSIAEITTRLQAIPGKVYACVEKENVTLEFDRYQATWNILVTDNDSEQIDGTEFLREPLTQVSVFRKARAFPLIQELLRQIYELQLATLSQIGTAFDLQAEAK